MAQFLYMEEQKSWLEEMIERQSIPETLRKETTKDFCEKFGINESTYYYQASKPENQKIILENSLNLAKKYTPDILENLAVRAKGDNKAAELFLEYVWKLSKQLDIKSDGKSIASLTEKQQALLDKLLYDKQSSNGQSNTGDTSRENIPV